MRTNKFIDCCTFLENILHNGPLEYTQIFKEAENEGYSKPLVERASRCIGVIKLLNNQRNSFWELSNNNNNGRTNYLKGAINFLKNILSNGPLYKNEIKNKVKNSEYSWEVISRLAAYVLNVKKQRRGRGKDSIWSLPDEILKPPNEEQNDKNIESKIEKENIKKDNDMENELLEIIENLQKKLNEQNQTIKDLRKFKDEIIEKKEKELKRIIFDAYPLLSKYRNINSDELIIILDGFRDKWWRDSNNITFPLTITGVGEFNTLEDLKKYTFDLWLTHSKCVNYNRKEATRGIKIIFKNDKTPMFCFDDIKYILDLKQMSVPRSAENLSYTNKRGEETHAEFIDKPTFLKLLKMLKKQPSSTLLEFSCENSIPHVEILTDFLFEQ